MRVIVMSQSEDTHPIKAARQARGLSLRETAYAAGVNICTYGLVCKWERGICVPYPARAEKLAKVLGFESGEELRRLCHEWNAKCASDNEDC
jgi:transcriptional regulator with XRE-family HTH domain